MKIKTSLLIVSTLGVIAGYVFTNSTNYGLCTESAYGCRSDLNLIGDPMFYGFGALAVVFVALMLVPKAYSAWKEFAVWFLPPAVAIFVTYKDVGGFGNFLPHSIDVFRFIAGVYIVCGLLAIIWSFFSKKGKGVKETKPIFMPASPAWRLAWHVWLALIVLYVVTHLLSN